MYIGVCTAITTSGGVCGLRDNIGADWCIRGHCSVAIVTSKRRVPVRRTVKILEQKNQEELLNSSRTVYQYSPRELRNSNNMENIM